MTDDYAGPVTTVPDPPVVNHMSSSDVDHARSVLNRFYYPIAVGVPDRADDFSFSLDVIQLGPLTVGRLEFASSVSLLASHLDGYHVTLPCDGTVLTEQAGHQVVARPEQAAVFRPGSPVHTTHRPRSVELDVKIDHAALEHELAAMLGHPVDIPIDLPRTMDLRTGPGQSWTRLVQTVSAEMSHPDSLIHQPLISERIRHSVLSGLLLSVPHRYHHELVAAARPGAPRAIERAVDAIRAEPERAFTVADLAVIAGMSVRSLQEGFRRHLGSAPMAYLQRMRLDRVHETLREADPDRTTVAAVAHRWGFAHLGRFAGLYRATFGVSPSETLRRRP